MEDNAPQQTIGRGVLDIQPNIEAVEKAKKDIEQMLDDLKVKARGIFDEVQFGNAQDGQVSGVGSGQSEIQAAANQQWQDEVLQELRTLNDAMRELVDTMTQNQ